MIFKHCDEEEETSIRVSFGFMSTKTYLDTQLSTGNSKKSLRHKKSSTFRNSLDCPRFWAAELRTGGRRSRPREEGSKDFLLRDKGLRIFFSAASKKS